MNAIVHHVDVRVRPIPVCHHGRLMFGQPEISEHAVRRGLHLLRMTWSSRSKVIVRWYTGTCTSAF